MNPRSGNGSALMERDRIQGMNPEERECAGGNGDRTPRLTVRELADTLRQKYGFLIEGDEGMRRVVEQVTLFAPRRGRESVVTLRGETGTGKEILAKAVHEASGRPAAPYYPLNCSAISPHLIEAELFGSVKGGYTDARDRKGAFEVADGGTIFMDEIADLSAEAQAKVLRVLDTGEFSRVGCSDVHRTDVKVACATHRNLEWQVSTGKFRRDLYYRLGKHIPIPPLRDRSPAHRRALIAHFLRQAAEEEGLDPSRVILDDDVTSALCRDPFPGNVRELETVIRQAITVARSQNGDDLRITAAHLEVLRDDFRLLPADHTNPLHEVPYGPDGVHVHGVDQTPVGGYSGQAHLSIALGTEGRVGDRAEMRIADEMIQRGVSKSDIAKALGMERSTLDRKLSRYAQLRGGEA